MQVISNMIEAHLFRETEGEIEFLLLKRSDKEIYPGLWQMVTGKIENGEKAYEAAIREIKEETGYIPERIWVAPNVNVFYSHENDTVSILPVFAAKVNGKINALLCDEHCEYKWVSANEAKTLLAWPGQKNSVDIISEYITNQIHFLNFIEIKM